MPRSAGASRRPPPRARAVERVAPSHDEQHRRRQGDAAQRHRVRRSREGHDLSPAGRMSRGRRRTVRRSARARSATGATTGRARARRGIERHRPARARRPASSRTAPADPNAEEQPREPATGPRPVDAGQHGPRLALGGSMTRGGGRPPRRPPAGRDPTVRPRPTPSIRSASRSSRGPAIGTMPPRRDARTTDRVGEIGDRPRDPEQPLRPAGRTAPRGRRARRAAARSGRARTAARNARPRRRPFTARPRAAPAPARRDPRRDGRRRLGLGAATSAAGGTRGMAPTGRSDRAAGRRPVARSDRRAAPCSDSGPRAPRRRNRMGTGSSPRSSWNRAGKVVARPARAMPRAPPRAAGGAPRGRHGRTPRARRGTGPRGPPS